MVYLFKHIKHSNIPDDYLRSFNYRYTARRLLSFGMMGQFFDEAYIVDYKRESYLRPLSELWPEYSRIHWYVVDGFVVSRVEVMKDILKGSLMGANRKEKWIVNQATNHIKEVTDYAGHLPE